MLKHYHKDCDGTLFCGDCLEGLSQFPDNHFDAVVTDPPYALTATTPTRKILESWLSEGHHPGGDGGFMGKDWDAAIPGPRFWAEFRRVLKPGGHVLAFCGTKGADLLGVAMRLAGLECRDTLGWLHAEGHPRGRDLSRLVDKHLGHEREVLGTSSSGGLAHLAEHSKRQGNRPDDYFEGGNRILSDEPVTPEARRAKGQDCVLKPAWEPILLFRKPLSGNLAETFLEHGTGGLRVAESAIDGRFPSNVLLDDHVSVALAQYGRYFFCGKASQAERHAGCEALGGKNTHVTVKPLRLMHYLVRLVCPRGGNVLDPFAGSGTTLLAAILEGLHFVGMELEEESFAIADARIMHMTTPSHERGRHNGTGGPRQSTLEDVISGGDNDAA